MAFDFITAGIELVNKGLEKFIPDANLRQQASMEIAQQLSVEVMGQIELDKADSASPRFFVAGWRPAVGWICTASLAYALIGHAVLNWLAIVIGHGFGVMLPLLPPPDASVTMQILFGMLGLGSLRTFEKFKGIAK